VPTYRLDLGKALRLAGTLLANAHWPDDTPPGDAQHGARQRLEESREILAQLVKQYPDNARYSSQLQLTSDELARLDSSRRAE